MAKITFLPKCSFPCFMPQICTKTPLLCQSRATLPVRFPPALNRASPGREETGQGFGREWEGAVIAAGDAGSSTLAAGGGEGLGAAANVTEAQEAIGLSTHFMAVLVTLNRH